MRLVHAVIGMPGRGVDIGGGGFGLPVLSSLTTAAAGEERCGRALLVARHTEYSSQTPDHTNADRSRKEDNACRRSNICLRSGGGIGYYIDVDAIQAYSKCNDIYEKGDGKKEPLRRRCVSRKPVQEAAFCLHLPAHCIRTNRNCRQWRKPLSDRPAHSSSQDASDRI